MRMAKLVPELICSDFDSSVNFYTEVLGFVVLYSRSEEQFAFLDRNGAQIMLEQSTGRQFLAGELCYPYGRGMNLQIEVSDIEVLYASIKGKGISLYLPLENKWYRQNDNLIGHRQFIIQDPNGYLLRFFQHLGSKPV